MPNKKFTPKQIENWKIYEAVRQSGHFNMYSAEARDATGLDRKEYMLCMGHYTDLKKQAEAEDATSN